MSSAQRLLAAICSGLQSERPSLHASTAHTNNGNATPPTALSTFNATGERKMSFDVEVNELMVFLSRVHMACTWKELTTSPHFSTQRKWRRSPRPNPSSFRLKVGLIRWSFCIGQRDESRQLAEISLDSIGRLHTRLLIHMLDFKRRFHTKRRCHCRQLRLILEFY